MYFMSFTKSKKKQETNLKSFFLRYIGFATLFFCLRTRNQAQRLTQLAYFFPKPQIPCFIHAFFLQII